MIVVVMGVSGAGKTTVGRKLAARLGWHFAEGDAFHPPENVAKMKAGKALNDADRAPWLAAMAARIDKWRRSGTDGVLACSALKRDYRRTLTGGHDDVRFVYLKGSEATIRERLGARTGHYMPASLLESQFAALEEPGADENAVVVPVDDPAGAIVESIAAKLGGSAARS